MKNNSQRYLKNTDLTKTCFAWNWKIHILLNFFGKLKSM